jgi:hypothetical protein
MIKRLVRVLRTASSERFILQAKDDEDSAALDLHYLASGNVAATLIVFESGSLADSALPDLLQEIDELLLPEVSVEHHKVTFTAVRGHVVGDFLPHKADS